MKVIKWFKSLFIRKSKIELCITDSGYFVIKAYGQLMPSTLTDNQTEAERQFKMLAEESGKPFVVSTIKYINV